MINFHAYSATESQLLVNRDYYDYVVKSIDNAKIRIWISMFIINATVFGDKYLMIRRLIKGLEYAKWRNVDVKIMLGISEISQLWLPNSTSMHYLTNLGLETREFNTQYRTSNHSKFILFDDNLIIAGSHNWSAKSLAGIHNEISIVLNSEDVSRVLSTEFLNNWNQSDK